MQKIDKTKKKETIRNIVVIKVTITENKGFL